MAIAGPLGELHALVCQDRVDLVQHGFEKKLRELPGCFAIGLFNDPRDGELAGSISGHEETELAFPGPGIRVCRRNATAIASSSSLRA